MLRITTLLITVTLLQLPSLARAQNSDALQQGVRVRVVSEEGEQKVGRVVSITRDSLQIASETSPAFVSTFATTSIRRLDKSLGESVGEGAIRGGLIGLLVGGVGGYTIMRLTSSKNSLATLAGAWWGSIGGLTAGVFLGAANPVETWVTLGLPYAGSSP